MKSIATLFKEELEQRRRFVYGLFEEKHLAGQHDQSSHGDGKGSGKDKFDGKAYSKLPAKGRVKMLLDSLFPYKERYVKVEKQAKAMENLSPRGKAKFKELNSLIGKCEGIRRAMINRGDKSRSKEQRKNYFSATALQAQVAATTAMIKKLK